jgi:hypothetical protein
MKSELMKVLDGFSVEEAYYAAGEAIPHFCYCFIGT